MHLYISGYKDAADILANRVIESGNNQDSLVYPIAFLYRQYIELQLKNIIKESRYLFEDTSGFPEHNKIKALWDVANGLMKKIIFELDKSAGEYITKKYLKAITCIINDFVHLLCCPLSSWMFGYIEMDSVPSFQVEY